MAQSSVPYDRPLPEICGRRPWEAPRSFLVKDEEAESGWREDESGRRPSDLLLAPSLREAVDGWRAAGYPGASEVTRELFRHWFEDEHEVPGFDGPLRFHFCQREAMETLAWLVEVFGKRDIRRVIERHWQANGGGQLPLPPTFGTKMDGTRFVRWRRGKGPPTEQDLPPADLRRYAFRMATGSGKTWVMAMAVVWAHLHRRLVPGSPLSTNFLIVAPNVIVFQRLRQDFEANRIFRTLPLIPSRWRQVFDQQVILRGDPTEPRASGNLFLTNIQQLYDRSRQWEPKNPAEALLGPAPSGNETAPARSMLERLASVRDLVVMNDEAHHVHDEELQWSRSLLDLHRGLPDGLSAWLDFSATPKDQGGRFFPWTVCDYPLPQAVEDRIVKAPVIVRHAGAKGQPPSDPDGVKVANAAEKYGPWIQAAVQCLKRHEDAYRPVELRPILFVMTDRIGQAKTVARHLVESYDFDPPEVLVIHTDAKGDAPKSPGKLDELRRAARQVDDPRSRVRVIVSVMMLREGWDVRNVSIVLGLRPFTAKAEILPEQVIGRGLRLMRGVSPDRTQTLEVLGTTNLLRVLTDQLESEGVSVAVVESQPEPPVVIRPLRERLAYDVALPDLGPRLRHDFGKLGEVRVESLDSVLDDADLPEAVRLQLLMEFATTESEIHQEEVLAELAPVQAVLRDITAEVVDRTRLPAHFARIFRLVRQYAETRCFGQPVDLEDPKRRSALAQYEVKDRVASLLAQAIAEKVVVSTPPGQPVRRQRLSETRPFQWRRNLPPLKAEKTVFNFVATYNDFERRFAEFLDRAQDVRRFAALAATEQGTAGVQFRVDYLKASGAVGFYYPDWALVQKTGDGAANWIVETKGREFPGTTDKDRAMRDWCDRARKATGNAWRFVRINQRDFDALEQDMSTFGELHAECFVRSLRRFRQEHVIKPMTLAEIREAIAEGRE